MSIKSNYRSVPTWHQSELSEKIKVDGPQSLSSNESGSLQPRPTLELLG